LLTVVSVWYLQPAEKI